MRFHGRAEVSLTAEKSLYKDWWPGCSANIGTYGIEGSDSEDVTSSVHTAPGSPSSIVELSIPNSQTAFPFEPKMDSSEVRLQAMEEELLANQVKTDTIQIALQSIMSKLEINTEKPREESKAIFALAEEIKGSNLGTGHAKIKPASPLDFDGN